MQFPSHVSLAPSSSDGWEMICQAISVMFSQRWLLASYEGGSPRGLPQVAMESKRAGTYLGFLSGRWARRKCIYMSKFCVEK